MAHVVVKELNATIAPDRQSTVRMVAAPAFAVGNVLAIPVDLLVEHDVVQDRKSTRLNSSHT